METKLVSAHSPEELSKLIQEHTNEGWMVWSSNANYLGVFNGKTTIGLLMTIAPKTDESNS